MKPFTPGLIKLPPRSVLTITAVGTPRRVFQKILPSLYGTAYSTKFKVFKPKGKTMIIGQLACAYPNALHQPMAKWKMVSDLEIPAFVRSKDLSQKNPAVPAKLARRPAGTYAQILHVGPYAKEPPTIKILHQFIKEQHLTIVGPHEEVYLTRPGPKAKTIIRYAVGKT